MPNTRDRVFDRVTVDHLVRGSTRVSFRVFYEFPDPLPWDFTLQAGSTGDPSADDWADVGLPARDAFYLVDDARRDFGTVRTVHYRVRLTTPLGVYLSRPAAAYGVLGLHDWLLAREVVRKERLRHRLATVPGWLLKRRRSGQPQPPSSVRDPRLAVLDPLTGDLIRRDGPGAAETLGTEYLGGYYAPVPFAFDVTDPAFFDALDPGVGNANPDAIKNSGRAVLFPSLEYRDVFAAAGSDLRYAVGRVTVLAAQRGVPLVGDAELRLLPFSDVVYTIAVPAGATP